jgi:mono/diheme cytochrome c family protein
MLVGKSHFYALTTMALIPVASLLVITGCAKNTESTPAAGQGNPPSSTAQSSATLIAAGKTVFNSNGCARCHAISGEGGKQGPELTHVGAEAEHTPDWIVAHVKNPRAHNPRSRMPNFEGKINDKDLLALGAYLSSLK